MNEKDSKLHLLIVNTYGVVGGFMKFIFLSDDELIKIVES